MARNANSATEEQKLSALLGRALHQSVYEGGEMSIAESALQDRQLKNPSVEDVYDDGYLRIEHKNYYLACDGQPIYLPRTEFLLISCLARSIDRVVTAEDLWRYARTPEKPFNGESLHVFMYRLRSKLLPYRIRIDTLVNVGYRLTIPSATSSTGVYAGP